MAIFNEQKRYFKVSIYDKLLAYLFFGKHMVPFNGKKETYQFLRNVPFCIKNVSTCDKTYQLVAKVSSMLGGS